MLKALIVEDDKLLASSLKAAIAEKFDADVCYNGLDGRKYINENVYDFIITLAFSSVDSAIVITITGIFSSFSSRI